MRRLGNLLVDFLHKNLEYGWYGSKNNDMIPTLIINKVPSSCHYNIDFRINLNYKDHTQNRKFLVNHSSNNTNEFYCIEISDRAEFLSSQGPYPTWEEALEAMELQLMEIIDDNIEWENIAEY